MKKQVRLKKMRLPFNQGFWLSAEYFEQGILKIGEGCHFSEKKEVARIAKKFKKLRGN